MRLVIQRVSEASVRIDQVLQGAIGQGLLVLLGVHETDEEEDLRWCVKKLTELRVFNDEDGKMNRSIKEINGDLLIISQFTLYASTKKGNRPSYIAAARPEKAIPLYERFKKECALHLGKEIESGRFGADMNVSLINDGPVTIILDSLNRM